MGEHETVRNEFEKEVEAAHPIRRLLMLDVLKDEESRPVFYWMLSTLLLGTVAYHWLEGWSYLDALYFCVISLATVGYGDLTPTTPLAKVFTIFYVINGIVILLAFFDRVRAVRQSQVILKAKRQQKSKAKGTDSPPAQAE